MENLRKRRWLSFNLRNAMLAFTATTVAFWVYWDGWQRWKWYLDQRTFIHSASQLKAGSHIDAQRPLLMESGFPLWWFETGLFDEEGNADVWQSYRWPNANYVVYWRYEDSYCTSVEVFLLPVAPVDFQPKTEFARREVLRLSQPVAGANRDADRKSYPPDSVGYTSDFMHMIQGDRRDSSGFDYELIHSDFSGKPADSSRD